MNAVYEGPDDLPAVIPVFPLGGALLLPRGRMPLNIFEPRYLAMVDYALGKDRVIGIIQPDTSSPSADKPKLYGVGCAGRIVQFAETGDGRYIVALAGISRFALEEELPTPRPYRLCRVSYEPYADDFHSGSGEDFVDREAVLAALRKFTDATGVSFDWDNVAQASNEALVNALSMLAPFGGREKQALLQAPDLKTRAETLVALTEIELARGGSSSSPTILQ
jgi:hypothetical protein